MYEISEADSQAIIHMPTYSTFLEQKVRKKSRYRCHNVVLLLIFFIDVRFKPHNYDALGKSGKE